MVLKLVPAMKKYKPVKCVSGYALCRVPYFKPVIKKYFSILSQPKYVERNITRNEKRK